MIHTSTTVPPRLTWLRVRNFRALRDVELRDLTPLTVLLGPNGAGKSTLFDVFAFLKQCFEDGLVRAWRDRWRFRELRTRGVEEPISIELKYREHPQASLLTYELTIDEKGGVPVLARERLAWSRKGIAGRPRYVLDYAQGVGRVYVEEKGGYETAPLTSPSTIAVNALGRFAKHPQVAALLDFITGWHLSYLSTHDARGLPDEGPQEHLASTGDNLANVIQYLEETHPERLQEILAVLVRRIPRLAEVVPEPTGDGRLQLTFRDEPFSEAVKARWVSDGTLKMLAYLTVLHDPMPPPFLGVEEPENYLHPRLQPELTEECRGATGHTQLFLTTHSADIVHGLDPKEVRVLYRGVDGYTRAVCAQDIPGIPEQVAQGASLGRLWREGHFGVGDPLTAGGLPTLPTLGAK